MQRGCKKDGDSTLHAWPITFDDFRLLLGRTYIFPLLSMQLCAMAMEGMLKWDPDNL